MGNIVTCTKRTYTIQIPNGIEMEVESEKPLSGATTAKLLEDDSVISTFLENINILDIKVPKGKIVHKKQVHDKKSGKKLKKTAKPHNELGAQEGQDRTPGDTDTQHTMPTPYERINMMITMGGELTRLDYQKFMEDKGHKISDFVGYADIENAVMLKRISPTGERIGKGRKKYRIIDVMPVEEYIFRKILRNHKVKRRY